MSLNGSGSFVKTKVFTPTSQPKGEVLREKSCRGVGYALGRCSRTLRVRAGERFRRSLAHEWRRVVLPGGTSSGMAARSSWRRAVSVTVDIRCGKSAANVGPERRNVV